MQPDIVKINIAGKVFEFRVQSKQNADDIKHLTRNISDEIGEKMRSNSLPWDKATIWTAMDFAQKFFDAEQTFEKRKQDLDTQNQQLRDQIGQLLSEIKQLKEENKTLRREETRKSNQT